MAESRRNAAHRPILFFQGAVDNNYNPKAFFPLEIKKKPQNFTYRYNVDFLGRHDAGLQNRQSNSDPL